MTTTIADLKDWIQYAPKVECKNPDLVGWTGGLGFVCSGCASRLTARGCGDRDVFRSPVWTGSAEALKDHDCVVCGAHWHGGVK
mgnify:CR=1 FL=1